MSTDILIVDDSRLVRLVLKNLLEQHAGWKVCAEAENGRVAVSKAQQSHPNVVVLDFEMPEMNGLEAARQIRQILPDVPIVLFTVHDIPAVQKEAERAGVRLVVDKTNYGAMVTAIEGLVAAA